MQTLLLDGFMREGTVERVVQLDMTGTGCLGDEGEQMYSGCLGDEGEQRYSGCLGDEGKQRYSGCLGD